MTRVADAIMNQNTAYLAGVQTPVVDPMYGGMLGWAPNIGEYTSNAAYVRDHVRCILLEAPKAFELLPNGDKWIGALRSFVEVRAVSIDGLNATLTVDFSQGNPVGGGGELQQDAIDVKQAVSAPVFRIPEAYGGPVRRFFRAWISYLIMDKDTKIPLISTLSNRPTDLLPDMISATMAFIECDPTGTKVFQSWICTNMMPHGTGDVTAHRDLTTAKEVPIQEIPFTAISQYGPGVDAFCQKLLDNMSIIGANPQLRNSFIDQIAPVVDRERTGYASNVQQVQQNAMAI